MTPITMSTIWLCSYYILLVLVWHCLIPAVDTKATKNVRIRVYKGPKDCTDENKVKPGNIVAIHYTATIDESSATGKAGKKIDSSRDKGIAQAVTVGRGKVIKGLDIGLQNLCKGAHAILIIPPNLAYGNNVHGPLPGKATVRYDIEVIDVKPEPPNEFGKIDANRDGKLSKEEAKEYFEAKQQAIDIDALWKDEDKDSDGLISWEEFTGSKGDGPPQIENAELSEEEQEDFERIVSVFKQVDTDGDLIITRKEMSAFLKASGQKMSLDDIWNSMDEDSDGKINWDEFLQRHFYEQQLMLQKQEEQRKQQKLKKSKQKQKEKKQNTAVFDGLDIDKDGRLTRDELAKLLSDKGLELTDQFWKESDIDGDGYISLQEFHGASNVSDESVRDEL